MPNTSASDLLRVARRLFADEGYAAASIGHIAEAAGLSKSAVLYHYASKEALLEAVLSPALGALSEVVERFQHATTADRRSRFVEPFIDFLLEHRLEMSIVVNQRQSLRELEIFERVDAQVQKLADAIVYDLDSVAERVRFGMALGGAAYALVATDNRGGEGPQDLDVLRAALVDTVSELLTAAQAPLSVR